MSIKIALIGYEEQDESFDYSDGWDRPDTYFHLEEVVATPSDAPADDQHGWYSSDAFDVEAVAGTVVYVVVARYSDGDTLGADHGMAIAMDVFTTSGEARELVAALSAVKYNQFTLNRNGKTYYIPWTGYFADLESLDVVEVTVA